MWRASARSARIKGLLKRGLLGVVSQVLNSASNVLIAVLIARVVTVGEFGRWGIAYAAYVLLLQLCRAVATGPMMLTANSGPVALDRPSKHAVGVSLGIGIVAASLLIGAALAAQGGFRDVLLAFGAVMTALLMQDSVRQVCFRGGKPGRAAVADLIWLIVVLAGVLALPASALDSASALTVLWGVGAFVAALPLLVIDRLNPFHGGLVRYIVENWSTSAGLVIDAVIVAAPAQLLVPAIALTSGLAEAGTLRGGQTVMGVVAMVIAGMTPIGLTEIVRSRRAGGTVLRGTRVVMAWSLMVLSVSAIYGAVVIALPAEAGRAVLGQTWQDAQATIVPLTLFSMTRGPVTGALLILKADVRMQSVVGLRLRTAPVTFLIPVAGSAIDGARGAAWGLALAGLITAVMSAQYIQRHDGEPPQQLLDGTTSQ